MSGSLSWHFHLLFVHHWRDNWHLWMLIKSTVSLHSLLSLLRAIHLSDIRLIRQQQIAFSSNQSNLPINTGRVDESARSRAHFPSLFFRFGSAPCCKRTSQRERERKYFKAPSPNGILRQTSTFPLLAASASGLKFQLSNALTSEWWLRSSWTTSAWPKLAALCKGIKPPSSFIWTLAFWLRRYSTTSFRPNPKSQLVNWFDSKFFVPELKWSGVDFLPSTSWALMFSAVMSFFTLFTSPLRQASKSSFNISSIFRNHHGSYSLRTFFSVILQLRREN